MTDKQEVSAGGVVYRKQGEAFEVLIAKHSGYHKWVLPKGLVEKDEALEQTAVREVREETGIVAKIVAPLLPAEKYTYELAGTKIDKTVHYFLMEYVGGEIEDHDFEMEEVAWVSFAEAIKRMGFAGARRVLEQARHYLPL
jgi:8-oxo-dGTP pyrophosphatase MutT (NUDIX family)